MGGFFYNASRFAEVIKASHTNKLLLAKKLCTRLHLLLKIFLWQKYRIRDKDYPRDRNVLNSVSAGNRIFINQRNTSRGRCNRNVYHTSLLLFMMTVHSRNKAR